MVAFFQKLFPAALGCALLCVCGYDADLIPCNLAGRDDGLKNRLCTPDQLEHRSDRRFNRAVSLACTAAFLSECCPDGICGAAKNEACLEIAICAIPDFDTGPGSGRF